MTSRFIGEEGFRWFIGKVEDRNDPLEMGRVKVRIYNVHSSKKSVAPTSEIPWATVMGSVYSASLDGVGIAPTGMAVGTTVIGFFLDAASANYPIVIGTMGGLKEALNGESNVPKESIGVNAANKDPYGTEPTTAFNASYPFNKVLRTEGGHVIEVDDTPNNERIHIYHKSGSYVEINNEGRTVRKSVGKDYEVVLDDKSIDVQGNITINATGTITLTGQAILLNP